jgi:short-subunit dehydrogenase
MERTKKTGQTVLVTGASSGLGADFARLAAHDGHDVVVVARRLDQLEALATRLRDEFGVEVHVIAHDLSQPLAAEALVHELTERGITVDQLINNAGVGSTGAFVTADTERELAMLTLNVTTLVHLTRLLLPGMVERTQGRVLNVSSTAGFLPGPFMADYYATKAFVTSFSQALAHEVRGTGVTVTVLCPGPTATEFAGTAGVEGSRLFALGTMTAARVAQLGWRGMQRGRTMVVPGWRNKLTVMSLRTAPRGVATSIAATLNQSGHAPA